MHTQNQGHSLPGVHCDVTNCVYNNASGTCHAEHIQVEHQVQESKTETDTFCGTFLAQ